MSDLEATNSNTLPSHRTFRGAEFVDFAAITTIHETLEIPGNAVIGFKRIDCSTNVVLECSRLRCSSGIDHG